MTFLNDSNSRKTKCILFFCNRGQILSTDSLTNQEDVELINEGIKYILRVSTSKAKAHFFFVIAIIDVLLITFFFSDLKVSKSGPNTFFVELNDSWTEVDAHRYSL